MAAINQQLELVGMRIARDSQLAVLSAVSASLENVKAITEPQKQRPASSPLPAGVGKTVDVAA